MNTISRCIITFLFISLIDAASAEDVPQLKVTFSEVMVDGERGLTLPVARLSDTFVSIYIEATEDISGPYYLEYSLNGVEIGEINIDTIASGITRLPDTENAYHLKDLGLHELVFRDEEKELSRLELELGEILPRPNIINADSPVQENGSKISISTQINNHELNTLAFTDGAIISTRSLGSDVFEQVSDGVVLITTKDGLGSGAIIEKDGVILTNFHVVGEQTVVTVRFKPESIFKDLSEESYVADVVYTDQMADLALIKLRFPPRELTAIQLAVLDSISIGDDVHAIGHPYGNTWSYTRGYISQFRSNYTWLDTHTADVIQTQTPINPGNSGGPLVLNSGELIGINSFSDVEADGLNYAVAISSIYEFLNDYYAQHENSPSPKLTSAKFISSIPFDENQNGFAEWQLFDEDINLVYERAELDQNEDNVVDAIYFDDNQNGVDELLVEYISGLRLSEKLYSVWYFDENEDGSPDRIGYDYNLDGRVDAFD